MRPNHVLYILGSAGPSPIYIPNHGPIDQSSSPIPSVDLMHSAINKSCANRTDPLCLVMNYTWLGRSDPFTVIVVLCSSSCMTFHTYDWTMGRIKGLYKSWWYSDESNIHVRIGQTLWAMKCTVRDWDAATVGHSSSLKSFMTFYTFSCIMDRVDGWYRIG